MITANEAKMQSTYKSKVKKLEIDIENAIKDAIDKGLFSTSISLPLTDEGDSNTVRTLLVSELKKNGFSVKVTDYAKTERHCPCDQAHYYDSLTVSW